jgi:hypothetical protein
MTLKRLLAVALATEIAKMSPVVPENTDVLKTKKAPTKNQAKAARRKKK